MAAEVIDVDALEPSLSPLSAAPLRPTAGAAEVETEYEDEEENDEARSTAGEAHPLEEVAEDLPPCGEAFQSRGRSPAVASDAGASIAGASTAEGSVGASSDYAVPGANREVWKSFGCDTEAGRMLKRLYTTKGDAASKVSYPPRRSSSAQRWEPKPAARKPCPQRTAVKVPHPVRRQTPDRDDPRNWRQPIPCRKPAEVILAEMEAHCPEIPENLPKGRDHAAEKESLQQRFRYCGGNALPSGAMGNVPVSEDLPQRATPRRDHHEVDSNGMTVEHRAIFEELMLAIKRKQERVKKLDAEEAADPRPSKAKTVRNKEALELKNDIDRLLKDIDTLLELTAT